MAELEEELKSQIIESLNLEDIEIGDIETDAALFGAGLGLDSIDALELVVIMDNNHGVKISDESAGKEVLFSIDSMAAFIERKQAEM